MSEQPKNIDYADDYCYDCDVMCKQTDPLHKGHRRLTDTLEQSPPDLGVSVSDGIGADDVVR